MLAIDTPNTHIPTAVKEERVEETVREGQEMIMVITGERATGEGLWEIAAIHKTYTPHLLITHDHSHTCLERERAGSIPINLTNASLKLLHVERDKELRPGGVLLAHLLTLTCIFIYTLP